MPTPPYNTPNKNLIVPAHGSDTGAWDVPVNADWASIDNAFGGFSTVGLASTNVVLTVAQYQPPNIILTGTISASLAVYFPSGVGGLWTIWNGTTGAFSVTIYNDTPGRGTVVPQSQRTLVVSDGTNVDLASTSATPANPTALVGLATINGVAPTFMRSDAANALDTSISPVWTGNHQFDGLVALVGPVELENSLTLLGASLIDASGAAIYVPTQASSDSTTKAASTAYVKSNLGSYATSASVTSAVNNAINNNQWSISGGVGASGYDTMPSGRIEMWGQSGTTTGVGSIAISFASILAGGFPTACLNVQVSNTNNTQELFYATSAITKNGFTANATSLGGGFFQWRAIGY